MKKRILAWALAVGARHRDTVYGGRQPSRSCGNWPASWSTPRCARPSAAGCSVFVSGGAPLGMDTAKWFASAGIALWEGYGLTETSPVIALNKPLSQRMGSVGRPLPTSN